MADGKKSVVLYCDLIHTVEKMDDATAGQFFKHYLRYVNDLDPTTDNFIVEIAFENVKQGLKRDLKKYEKRAERSRINGMKGGRPKEKEETQKTHQVISKPRKPDSVNDNVIVSVNVNDNVNDNDKVVSRTKKIVPLTVTHSFLDTRKNDLFDRWLAYRKEIKKPITSPSTIQQLITKFESADFTRGEAVVNLSIENGWQGLFWEKLDTKQKTNEQLTASERNKRDSEASTARILADLQRELHQSQQNGFDSPEL